jgi:protein AroM
MSGERTQDAAAQKWRVVEDATTYVAASPYRDTGDAARAAGELQGSSVDLVVMDRIGYTEYHRQLALEAIGKPVILAASLAARVLGELLRS